MEDVCADQVLKHLELVFDKQKEKLSVDGNRTVKLWMQYLNMVGIIQRFLRTDRFVLWEEYQHVVKSMLLCLAAVGHNQ